MLNPVSLYSWCSIPGYGQRYIGTQILATYDSKKLELHKCLPVKDSSVMTCIYDGQLYPLEVALVMFDDQEYMRKDHIKRNSGILMFIYYTYNT